MKQRTVRQGNVLSPLLFNIATNEVDDPGGPVVIILATGSEVRGFKPGQGRWIFSENKNSEYIFLWKRSKAGGPVS